MDSKKWYTSKTLWVNLIAVVAEVLGVVAGINITPELAVTILAVINIILRAITKEPIEWKSEAK
jgi:hypothetical protein